jgi:hypothetical protein
VMVQVGGRGSIGYEVDIALTIDATNSMTPLLAGVKEAATGFHGALLRRLTEKQKAVSRLRVRVVVFRDVNDNGTQSLEQSEFFELPQQEQDFAAYVAAIGLQGNSTYPESGLAGLSAALKSNWSSGGLRRRHIVVLWTDDDAHLPEQEYESAVPEIRSYLAESFDALTDEWHAPQPHSLATRRLVLFAPDRGAWHSISRFWENVILFPARAGEGLAEVEQSLILDSIVNSI